MIQFQFFPRSRGVTREIQDDSAEKAQEIWEEMSLKEVVGKEKIDIEDLEDGIIVAIDEES